MYCRPRIAGGICRERHQHVIGIFHLRMQNASADHKYYKTKNQADCADSEHTSASLVFLVLSQPIVLAYAHTRIHHDSAPLSSDIKSRISQPARDPSGAASFPELSPQ